MEAAEIAEKLVPKQDSEWLNEKYWSIKEGDVTHVIPADLRAMAITLEEMAQEKKKLRVEKEALLAQISALEMEIARLRSAVGGTCPGPHKRTQANYRLPYMTADNRSKLL